MLKEIENDLIRLEKNDLMLTEVDWSEETITDQQMQQLAGALGENNQLIRLNLDKCKISPAGIGLLIEGIGNNATLEELSLKGRSSQDLFIDVMQNPAGDRVVPLELQVQSSLVKSEPSFDWYMVCHLAAIETNNEFLRRIADLNQVDALNLATQNLTDAHLRVLARRLRGNTSLVYLQIDGNQFTEQATEIVREMLCNPAESRIKPIKTIRGVTVTDKTWQLHQEMICLRDPEENKQLLTLIERVVNLPCWAKLTASLRLWDEKRKPEGVADIAKLITKTAKETPEGVKSALIQIRQIATKAFQEKSSGRKSKTKALYELFEDLFMTRSQREFASVLSNFAIKQLGATDEQLFAQQPAANISPHL